MKRNLYLILSLCIASYFCQTTAKRQPDRSFCVIQFTDPQMGFMDSKGTFSLQHEKRLMDQAVNIIRQRKPDFVIGTGDFLHLALNDSATALFEDYIGKIREVSKLYMVPGNHDLPKLTPEYTNYYKQHFGEDHWAFKYKNCAFIGLNSSILQSGTPAQEAEHYAWLEKQLTKMRKCKFKFVFMHISFFTKDMDEKEKYFNQPKHIRQKYLKLLEQYGVDAVFSGHLHRNAYGKYHNIEIVTSNAVGRDLSGEDKHGMTLIEISPDGYSHKYMTMDELLKK